MSDTRKALGKKGEDLAALHLEKLGFTILARNYRQKFGEIDIIARDRDSIVFVEVKTRQAGGGYSPAEAVTPRKQLQIARTAQNYLASNRLFDTSARFDVVSVLVDADGRCRIDHLRHAFDLPASIF